MLSTWIRSTTLVFACLLLTGVGRPDDKPTAPPPRPAGDPAKDWETKFAGRTPEEVLAALERLAAEWTARKGAVEVARLHLMDQASAANKVRAKAAGLMEPDATLPLVFQRPADVDAALKTAQLLVEYHAARIQLLDAAKTARDAFKAR